MGNVVAEYVCDLLEVNQDYSVCNQKANHLCEEYENQQRNILMQVATYF
jgi:hypothetical protein